jgi:hypothetical protein
MNEELLMPEPRMNIRSATAAVSAVVLTALLTLLLAIASGPPARAGRDDLNRFNQKYGTAGTRLDSCSTCHMSQSESARDVNRYGTDYAGADHDFATVEPKDSDGDGVTNIDEIRARTFPGDPNDRP